MREEFKRAEKFVVAARNILIISHRKPDADTLGGAIAIKFWLISIGKRVTLACIDRPSRTFSFLPCVKEYVNDFKIEKFDLVIVVDAGASYMTNFHLKYPNIFDSGIAVINIDHHPSNDNFGTVNIVDFSAASTTLIIYRMFELFEVKIDENIAMCLLAGLYGDTGSFMHSNTTEEVYAVAADLMNKGAKISIISKALFNTNSVSTLRLWGKVLEKVVVTSDRVVMSVIKDEELDDDVSDGHLSGIIDYLNMVPDSKFAVLINEDRKGNVKGSFRTRNADVDLSKIAAEFGGGGHPKAAGFCVKGKLKKATKYEIITAEDEKKYLEF